MPMLRYLCTYIAKFRRDRDERNSIETMTRGLSGFHVIFVETRPGTRLSLGVEFYSYTKDTRFFRERDYVFRRGPESVL